jgi:hypothetical protein
MELYFPEGVPKGNILIKTPITLAPKLSHISPSTGSAGGSLLTATVSGVGMLTANVDIVDGTGASVCASIQVVAYGKVECFTKVVEIPAASALSIKISNTISDCINTDLTQCQYE